MQHSSSDQGSSSQNSAANTNGGIRIAGVASRTPSASASVVPSPATQTAKETSSPIKLDRDRHAAHRLPARPMQQEAPRSAGAPSRPAPQRPQDVQRRGSGKFTAPPADDDDEEGAIDDAPRSSSGSGFRPPPPKTPPHPSGGSRASNDERAAGRDQQRPGPYQPRSPSPQRRTQPPAPSHASHLRSPSPPRSSRDDNKLGSHSHHDDRHYRHQGDRREYDRYHSEVGNGAPRHRARDDRYPAASSRDWDRGQRDTARGWEDDRRDDRSWSDHRRPDRQWGREPERQGDRGERERPWGHERHGDHRSGEYPRDRPYERNGRYRVPSPPAPAREQRYAGWSPTPPDTQPSSTASNGKHGEAALPPRPQSRMGRAAPPPPLLSHTERPPPPAAVRDPEPTALKRPRSRSPPAGLLKRKANFNAVVPPTLAPFSDKEGETDNVAPGAPIPPKIDSMQSPVLPIPSRVGSESVANTALPGSRPGSVHPTATATASSATVAADANYDATCDALDDFSVPSVRLSCLPRKLPDAPPLSGRERRKLRGPPTPLNQRKFVGCSSLDDYEISIKLGQGTFGEVLKGRQILTGVAVALKKVTIHDAKDGLPITALREIKLLKKLHHPSIVPVIDMAFRPSTERGKLGDVYMVEPYMDHDLNGMLENPAIRLEHSQIKLYMKQLLQGTLYLHKNRILHRDMKAANLLINNAGQLQIADFGLARAYRDPGQSWTGKGWVGGTHRYTNMVVTRWYRPPELLAGEKRYGPPIDMWGIGCILAEMVMGKPLFKGTSEINQLELIAKLCGSPNETSFPGWTSLPGVKDADPTGRPDAHPEVPGQHAFGDHPRRVKEHFRTVYDAGPGCADLIDKLLVLDPRKRLTAQEALEHEWFWTKPYPADRASLPKYEHSKEIDRGRREWRPAPAAAVGGAVGPPGGAGAAMGARPGLGQMAYPAQPQGRPYARPAPYAPNGGPSNPAEGWDRTAPGRPFSGPQGAQPRFPYPNAQRPTHPYPPLPQGQGQGQFRQHGLPATPDGPPRNGAHNPYS